MAWLIQLRWIAVLCVSLTLVLAFGLGVIDHLLPPLGVVFGLSLFNATLWAAGRKHLPIAIPGPPKSRYRRVIALQLHVDLFALTLLLHWSGGVENPFSLFYLFHIAIGSILLTTRQTAVLVASGCLMFCVLSLGEYGGFLEHHPIKLISGIDGEDSSLLAISPFFVLGKVFATCLTMVGVAFFLQSVVRRQREAEILRRQHERIAVSRQRLARIGEISAGLAHSIRNPLHGVLNCLEMVPEEALDESDRENLALMREGLYRIQGVTDRLLVLTRDAPLRRQPGDLIDQVRELIRYVEPQAAKAGIEIRSELAPVPSLMLDPDRIHEVLFNILDNALDACRESGGRRITIRGGTASGDGGKAFIEIEDEGPGLEEGWIEKIFDPFFTTKAIGEGTGLGLAIARRVVEEHGGRILVRSKKGRGCCFRVELPLGDRPLAQELEGEDA